MVNQDTFNDLILRAARGEDVERVPVWIMRQAGRYLPEFQEIRKRHDFFTICRTPELACEVTLMPLKRFALDAAIIFSDILVVPQALGLQVEMQPGVGPVFPEPLIDPEDARKRLNFSNDICSQLAYVMDAIKLTRRELNGSVPLIGFSAAPWTLLCYMIEGRGTKTASKTKHWLYAWRADTEHLMSQLSDVIIDYLVGQAKAGAQMLQIFESLAEHLTSDLIDRFSITYLERISRALKQKLVDVPLVVFVKGAQSVKLVQLAKQCHFDVISVDFSVDVHDFKSRLDAEGVRISCQGNLDPCALYGSHEEIRRLTANMIGQFSTQGYIANLGHGIYPDVPVDSVECFVNAVHNFTS